MTIDEAIIFERKESLKYMPISASYHNQLAEWLEELKAYKGSDDCPNIYKIGFQDGVVSGIEYGRKELENRVKKLEEQLKE